MLVRTMSSRGIHRGCQRLAVVCLAALVTAVLASTVLAASKAGAAKATAPVKPMPVVASFSVLGDMVSEIGGEHIELTTIIGLGGDAHAFEPTPEHARALADARVLVLNGLGFEEWLPRLVAASGFEGQQVVATHGITPRMLDPEQQGAHAGHDHDHDHDQKESPAKKGHEQAHGERTSKHHHEGGVDPHAWQSLKNGVVYARNIAEGLAKADPAHASNYAARANRYIEEMKKLDTEMRQVLDQIAPEKRKVVVPHDSLGYFGEDYGIEFIPVMGISGQAEASARNVAAIVDQVRASGGAAVFLESATNSKLVEQVARELDIKVGGTLYVDTLSEPDQPAGTYLGMIKWNAGQLIYALKPREASGS